MKKIYLLFSVLFFVSLSNAQELPNAGLEEWETLPNSEFEEPVGWNSPNPYTALLGKACVSKSDDAAEGDFSARLETVLISLGPLEYRAPGLITYADFNLDFISGDYTFGGGIYMPHKVYSLSGKYKYSPAESDSATVILYSYAHPEGEDLDTIGIGYGFLHAAAEWSDFEFAMIPINDHAPDSFNVLLMSTGSFEIDLIPVGSVLHVDDLSIETSVGIFDLPDTKTELTTYPNPATDVIYLETPENNINRTLRVFDMTGREVKNVSFESKSISINIAGLPKGVYSYILQKNSTLLNSGSFIKK